MTPRSLGVLAACAVVTWIVAAGAPSAAQATNYDGTGTWSQPDCSHDCFQLDLVQNHRGDLTLRDGFCEEVDCHVEILFRRVGPRPKVGGAGEYEVSLTGLPGDERECINQTGVAQIDAASVPNIMTLTLSGVNWQGPDAGCQPEAGGAVFER